MRASVTTRQGILNFAICLQCFQYRLFCFQHLEHREMQLDDGRLLVGHARFDSLLSTASPAELRARGLVRVHPAFRVIALGTPVPAFPGLPLDPPLRSRFQARAIHSLLPLEQCIEALCRAFPRVHVDLVSRLAVFCETLRILEATAATSSAASPSSFLSAPAAVARPPHLVADCALLHLCALVAHVSPLSAQVPLAWLHSVYPQMVHSSSSAQREMLHNLLMRFQLVAESQPESEFEAATIATAVLVSNRDDVFVDTPHTSTLLAQLQLAHTVGRHVAIVATRGSGKSACARRFGRSLASDAAAVNQLEFIYCFRDMSSRELLMRRATSADGSTEWVLGPLARAAIEGKICVLDGIDRLTSGVLSALSQLLCDNECTLADGTRLVSAARFRALIAAGIAEHSLSERRVYAISKKFRVIALAAPPTAKTPWLTPEVTPLFAWHTLGGGGSGFGSSDSASGAHTRAIVRARHPLLSDALLTCILAAGDAVAKLSSGALQLSLRHYLRVALHVQHFGGDALSEVFERVLLTPLLPAALRALVRRALIESGCASPLSAGIANASTSSSAAPVLAISVSPTHVTIGDCSMSVATPASSALIPQPLFFDIPRHVQHLQCMMQQFICGERFLLLIGTQGVGKNRLADRFCQLLRREREYMQLHRDSSIAALTCTPSMEGGRVLYIDSPLVRAAIHGRVLLLDECDKVRL